MCIDRIWFALGLLHSDNVYSCHHLLKCLFIIDTLTKIHTDTHIQCRVQNINELAKMYSIVCVNACVGVRCQ